MALLASVAVACGRLGYDPLGELAQDGAPVDGGSPDASPGDASGGVDAGLPPGCLVVTTVTDELDSGESATPPHLGSGLSLREAITLANAAPGAGCVGFVAPLALTWTMNPPTISDALELHGAGSVLADAQNVASGLVVGAGGGGTVIEDLAVVGYDQGITVSAGNVTLGPGVRVEGNNVGVRLFAAGSRIVGSRILTSNGSGVEVQANDTTIDLTVVAHNGAAGIITSAGVSGLTVRHVTLDGNATGCNFRSNPTGVLIRNTIISHSAGAGIDASGATQMDVDYVDTFGNNVACSGCTLGARSILGDPGFVDAAALDYHLVATSPAIDVGIDTALDVNGAGAGRFNGAAPDLGAFER
jgi:hypothetical protein